MNKIFTAVIFFVGISGSWAGYAQFLCPIEGNSTIFFPCQKDCEHQHGAKTGRCGDRWFGDYNCYCSRTTTVAQGYHCAEDTWNYRQLCVVDCQCNHGAKSGYCEVEKKACQCTGRDRKNTECQMRNPLEFAQFTAKMMPRNSTAWDYIGQIVPKSYLNE